MNEYEEMCAVVKESLHQKRTDKGNREKVSFFIIPNEDTPELRLLLLIDNPNNPDKLGPKRNEKLPIVFSSSSAARKYKLVQLLMDAKNPNVPPPKECVGWDLTKRELF